MSLVGWLVTLGCVCLAFSAAAGVLLVTRPRVDPPLWDDDEPLPTFAMPCVRCARCGELRPLDAMELAGLETIAAERETCWVCADGEACAA